MDVNGYITEKWLCNISSTTLLKRQCCRSSFSSPVHCFPSLPPAGPSSPTSQPLPSSSTSKHCCCFWVGFQWITHSHLMTGVNLKEVAGSYGQVQAEGTAPLFGSSSASCTISPFVSSGCSQTWGHQPRPLHHHSCMWRWEVRKCHRLTQGCVGAEEHREDLLALCPAPYEENQQLPNFYIVLQLEMGLPNASHFQTT